MRHAYARIGFKIGNVENLERLSCPGFPEQRREALKREFISSADEVV